MKPTRREGSAAADVRQRGRAVLRRRSRLVLADLRIPKRGIRNLAGSLTGQTAMEARVPAIEPLVRAAGFTELTG
jgi:hypothetical protein